MATVSFDVSVLVSGLEAKRDAAPRENIGRNPRKGFHWIYPISIHGTDPYCFSVFRAIRKRQNHSCECF